jgi:lysophospholipase L1-like esterase
MPGLISTLRKAHPTTPIVLVEHIYYPDGAYVEEGRGRKYRECNAALAKIYAGLSASDPNLLYIEGKHLLGDDGEATVDGTHPTDLGMTRMAQVMEPTLRSALALSAGK